MKEKDVYNGGVVATADTLQTGPTGKEVFVTAVAEGVYLKRRKRGETFGFPAEQLFNDDGSKKEMPSWFVLASDGDVKRQQDAVEVAVSQAESSPRYTPSNSPEAARSANAARADVAKAKEQEYAETPEQKAARLQAEARADVEGRAPRTSLADAEKQADKSVKLDKDEKAKKDGKDVA